MGTVPAGSCVSRDLFGIENVENVAHKVVFAEKKLSFIESGIFRNVEHFTICLWRAAVVQ